MIDDRSAEHESIEQDALRRIQSEKTGRDRWEEENRIRQEFQIRFPGGGIFVPNSWSGGIKPHLKWIVWAISLGGLVIMVLYGVSLVMS
jgi:hypothetical protein